MSLNDYLLCLGSFIVLIGIILIIISRKFIKKTYLQKESFKNSHYMGRCSEVLYKFDPVSSVIYRIKIDAKNEDLEIIYHKRSYNKYFQRALTDDEEITLKSGEFCEFGLNPNYSYTIRFEIPNLEKDGLFDSERCFIKTETPYEWLLTIGSTFLTIGFVLFTATLKP